MFSKNKILITVVVVIFFLAVGFWGYTKYVQYKKTQEQTKTEEQAAVVKEQVQVTEEKNCLESIEAAPAEEIAKLIARVGVGRDILQNALVNYFGCRFPWFASPEIIEKYTNLARSAGISEEQAQIFENKLNDSLSGRSASIQKRNGNGMPLIYVLIKDIPLESICPGGTMDEDIFMFTQNRLLGIIESSGIPAEKIKTYIEMICPSFLRYENNPILFEEEVLKRNTWPEDSVERLMAYRIADILFVRFGDQESTAVSLFCKTLPNLEEIKACQNYLSGLFANKEKGLALIKELAENGVSFWECNKSLTDLRSKICTTVANQ